MNGTEDDQTMNEPGHEADALTELFRHVSARRQPPVADEQIVRQALHEQWQHMTRGKRNERVMWPWALAASVVLATVVGVAIKPWSAPTASVQKVAYTQKAIGPVTLGASGEFRVLSQFGDEELIAGQTIKLGLGSKLALRWINGAAIRLDERTEVKLISDRQVFLVSGRIYMDTGPADHSASPVAVITPQGVVQHLGTQFITQVSPAGTSISVREGEVAYLPSDGAIEGRTLANVGQQLAVAADGKIIVETISTWGPDWEWAESLSSGFPSDGRSLAELLAWAGRESGRQVKYHSPDAEKLAMATVLRGDLDVQPIQALSIATATSDLIAEVSNGWIIVRSQETD